MLFQVRDSFLLSHLHLHLPLLGSNLGFPLFPLIFSLLGRQFLLPLFFPELHLPKSGDLLLLLLVFLLSFPSQKFLGTFFGGSCFGLHLLLPINFILLLFELLFFPLAVDLRLLSGFLLLLQPDVVLVFRLDLVQLQLIVYHLFNFFLLFFLDFSDGFHFLL